MRWFKIAGEKLNKNVPYQAGSKAQLDSALLEAGGVGSFTTVRKIIFILTFSLSSRVSQLD